MYNTSSDYESDGFGILFAVNDELSGKLQLAQMDVDEMLLRDHFVNVYGECSTDAC